MTKYFFTKANMLLMAVVTMMTLTACGSDDDDRTGTGGDNTEFYTSQELVYIEPFLDWTADISKVKAYMTDKTDFVLQGGDDRSLVYFDVKHVIFQTFAFTYDGSLDYVTISYGKTDEKAFYALVDYYSKFIGTDLMSKVHKGEVFDLEVDEYITWGGKKTQVQIHILADAIKINFIRYK